MAKFKHILICIPSTSQSMKTGTAMTFGNVILALQNEGISTSFHNIDSAEIVTARDMFANMVLHSETWDGLLFIDSDMAFDPRLVLKLVRREADLAAAACPRRSLDLDRLVASARSQDDLNKAVANASDFTVNLNWDGLASPEIQVDDGFIEAASVGMAIALISRDVFVTMVNEKVVSPRLDLNAGPGRTCWSFFEPIAPLGSRLGEDYSFCYRWTGALGRKLVVCVDEPVMHIGYYEYTARYADLFD